MRGGDMMKEPMAMKRGGKVMKGKKKKVMKKKKARKNRCQLTLQQQPLICL